MKLSELLDTVESKVAIKGEEEMPAAELQQLKQAIGLAAIKYGDLMNPCESNYIFDIDKFASFEGNTGPYILYTMVRIKSILAKLKERHPEIAAAVSSGTTTSGTACRFAAFTTASERDLALTLTRFSHTLGEALKKMPPPSSVRMCTRFPTSSTSSTTIKRFWQKRIKRPCGRSLR